ncbi:hypothetical protein TESG_04042 [Trichophyton tonsurans CBS 112818]|uniref:Uncharacterized protein n=1 Tax=Trichophyton tonsurans (strain CBS 112818) TaxID=647933 RepID=F2RZ57_TRIT1|nr:hypothetical protein TESG_04042 [Trichophyton tonsurans CBS 112818]
MESLKSGLQAAEDALLGHKSGQEPASGVQGKGTATDPYDAGNAPTQPTETQGLAGKHGAGQQTYGNKIDEGVGGFHDTTGRTTGKPTTGSNMPQEAVRVPGRTTQGTERVDEGISGVGGDKTGYGERALRSEMQQADQYSSAMGAGQKPSTATKMSGGLTDDTLGGAGAAGAAGVGGVAAGTAGAGAMGRGQELGMTSMKQQPGMTDTSGRAPGAATNGSDMPSGTSGGYGQTKQSQLGSEYGGAALGSGDVTGTGHGTRYQQPSGSTTHGQHGTTGDMTGSSGYGGSSQYPSEIKQGQTAGSMPGGSSSATGGYGSSDIKQGAPTAGYGGTQTGISQGTSTTGHAGSGYGGSQYPSEMNQGGSSTGQTAGGSMGRTTDTGYGASSQPSSAMRHDAPTSTTNSRTTSSVPSHAPVSGGENPVKSTGFAAEGGNFDATQPGAGREADRLLDQRTSKAGQGTSTTGHGNTGTTTNEPHTGTHETHTTHRSGSIAQKAKDALHIGKHSKT